MSTHGATIYDGPSAIDGKPILGIVTFKSRNPKTGPMAQLWILPRGIHPAAAMRSGKDRSVCGDCPIKSVCYVNPMGPSTVWRRWRERKYSRVRPAGFDRILRGRALRLGAYGDPAALPFDVVKALTVAASGGWTGYTHQWENADPRFAGLIMASADNPKLRAAAIDRGYRTFSVIAPGAMPIGSDVVCPATPEGGKRTTCINCQLCNGTTAGDRRKNIATYVHGAARGRFINLRIV